MEATDVTPLEILIALVKLQEIDLRIHKLEKDRKHIPQRLIEIETLLQQRLDDMNKDKAQLEEAEMARRLSESDLKAEKDKIKKWEARLNDLKNSRDYQALSRETEASRKANLAIEDEILRKMQEIEDLKTSIKQKEDSLSDMQQSLFAEKAELEQNLAAVNAIVEREGKSRNERKVGIEPRWLKQYEVIRVRRDGLGVVPVLNENCQGCHMGSPPQQYNIVLRGQQIETCPYCHRFLYYEPALNGKNDHVTKNVVDSPDDFPD